MPGSTPGWGTRTKDKKTMKRKTTSSPKQQPRHCDTCAHARLVAFRPGDPILCECQLAWAVSPRPLRIYREVARRHTCASYKPASVLPLSIQNPTL